MMELIVNGFLIVFLVAFVAAVQVITAKLKTPKYRNNPDIRWRAARAMHVMFLLLFSVFAIMLVYKYSDPFYRNPEYGKTIAGMIGAAVCAVFARWKMKR